MILVTGSTGFIGSHLLHALKESGHDVKCLVHNPARATRCSKLGFSAVAGDIATPTSLKRAFEGVDIVAHLVGIIEERGSQTFQKVHVEGTSNLVEESVESDVKQFIYISALGVNANSPFQYHRTKAKAEEIVKSSGIPYTIFRPSLVIGPGGGFVGKMLDLINAPGPFIPVPGNGNTLFQPIYVEDLARCIVNAVGNPDATGKTFEVGGPEHLTYNELLLTLADVVGRRKRLIHIPMGLMMTSVRIIEKFGLSPVTSDQLGMLNYDNICDADIIIRDFGFEPTSYRQALERSTSRQAPDS